MRWGRKTNTRNKGLGQETRNVLKGIWAYRNSSCRFRLDFRLYVNMRWGRNSKRQQHGEEGRNVFNLCCSKISKLIETVPLDLLIYLLRCSGTRYKGKRGAAKSVLRGIWRCSVKRARNILGSAAPPGIKRGKCVCPELWREQPFPSGPWKSDLKFQQSVSRGNLIELLWVTRLFQ